jgi:hypothetical protein
MTKVSSLAPVLEHLAFEEPYSGASLADPLAEHVRAREAELERLLGELHLGYKLHCLAIKRA